MKIELTEEEFETLLCAVRDGKNYKVCLALQAENKSNSLYNRYCTSVCEYQNLFDKLLASEETNN